MTSTAVAKAGLVTLAINSIYLPPCSAMAVMPSSGRPTPVVTKPAMATSTWSPAACPSAGGKIRLPAPKKMENIMSPMVRSSPSVILCIE